MILDQQTNFKNKEQKSFLRIHISVYIYFSDKMADGIEGLSIVDKRYDDLILENDTCEVKTIKNFTNEDDFVKYTNRYSVFGEEELKGWYKNKDNFTVIKMVYNIAFTKKVINKVMKERVGLNPRYWGFFRLTDAQFDKLLELGEINERYIVD